LIFYQGQLVSTSNPNELVSSFDKTYLAQPSAQVSLVRIGSTFGLD